MTAPLLAVAHGIPPISAHRVLVQAIKTLIVFVLLVVGFRLLGKREAAQLNVYDLAMLMALANAVQNAMINNDNTLGGGVVAALVLLLANRLLNVVIVRSPKVERALVGEPVLIVSDGVVLQGAMERQGITRDQLEAALREHGYDSLDGIHSVILEVDGSMSVVPRQATVTRTRRHYRGLRLP